MINGNPSAINDFDTDECVMMGGQVIQTEVKHRLP